jgi:hypothetical protein
MARKSSQEKDVTTDPLVDDIFASYAVLSEGFETMNPTVKELGAQLGQLGKDLFESPLGVRAQRHPVIAVGIIAGSFLLIRRAFFR